jgi:hypothetical protein
MDVEDLQEKRESIETKDDNNGINANIDVNLVITSLNPQSRLRFDLGKLK